MQPSYSFEDCGFRNLPESSKQVRSSEVDNLVSAAIEDRPDQIQVEIDDLVELERRRHGELLSVHGNVHQSRTIVREGFFQGRPNLFGIVHVDTKHTSGFCNLDKIWCPNVEADKHGCGSRAFGHFDPEIVHEGSHHFESRTLRQDRHCLE